jgi:hypothetical protein
MINNTNNNNELKNLKFEKLKEEQKDNSNEIQNHY